VSWEQRKYRCRWRFFIRGLGGILVVRHEVGSSLIVIIPKLTMLSAAFFTLPEALKS
jgi:hypothetical protein